MDEVFELTRGDSPLLVSIPHSGTTLPASVEEQLTDEALLLADTDWFIPEIYDFIFRLDISVVKAKYSRLLIDLNRPPDNTSLYEGKVTTGLCPLKLFDGEPVYRNVSYLTENEISRRLESYWKPYHAALTEEITRLKAMHGYCIVYDAHSIRSAVPSLFKGKLPDLNLGTNNGLSCGSELQRLVESLLNNNNSFSSVVNQRFIGGYITRHYGSPLTHCHAVQMEIAQCAYMDEDGEPNYDSEKAKHLKYFLEELFNGLLDWPLISTE
ncbi:MAG: N-formylglutamate deformylase [Gammaproteobacteria bacterium]